MDNSSHFSSTSFSYQYLSPPANSASPSPPSIRPPFASISNYDFYKPEKPIKSILPPVDQLEIITTGSQRGDAEKLAVFLDNQGNLYEKFYDSDAHTFSSKPPYNLIGKVETSGDYTLLNGEKGNILTSPTIMLATGDATSTFGEALRQAESKRALENSEIPWIRENLTQKGWNGAGTRVGIIELDADEDLPMKTAQHGLAVASIVVDPKYGIAPAAKTQLFNPGSNDDRPDLMATQGAIWKGKYVAPVSDNIADLHNRLIRSMAVTYEDMSDSLLNICNKKKEPDIRVLNMSIGSGRLDAYTSIKDILNTRLPDNNTNSKNFEAGYQYPKLRTLLLGPLAGTDGQKDVPLDKVMQASIHFVDNALDQSQDIQQAHEKYIQTTKTLANQGIILVVGTGNDHYSLSPQKFNLKPGWELSDYAKSPYVISVAATDTERTPGNQSDDSVASFSSRGDGTQWNPTVAAPGNCILMPRWAFSNGVQYGTSFAAPYVTGTIALMLQKNPTLTFFQIKEILQRSAVHVPLTVGEVGAGIVNPVLAMAQTPALAATSSFAAIH